MSKKRLGTICGIIMIISGALCSTAYMIGDSKEPWWLIVFLGAITCAIAGQVYAIKNEKKEKEKHMKKIGLICSSICMISVFAFLAVQMLTGYKYSWLIVFFGGVISGIASMIGKSKYEDE